MIKKQFITIIFIISVMMVTIYLIGLDYSSLKSISSEQLKLMFKGLIKPDWAFINDGSREDLISLLLVTVAIAFIGVFMGMLLAFPIAVLSSKRLMKSWPLVPIMFKSLLNFMRAIPTLIYAILFVRIVGPGPFAGVLAIGLQMVGMLGKLFSEAFDTIDDSAYETLVASAASKFQAFQYGRLPLVRPLLLGYTLNHFEIGIRSAAVLGLVGAGGIGAPIIFALQARQWSKVSIILLGIIVLVMVTDRISLFLRRKVQ